MTDVIRGAGFDNFGGSAQESVAVDHLIGIGLWRCTSVVMVAQLKLEYLMCRILSCW